AVMSRLAHRNSFNVRKLQGRAKVSQRARPSIICALFNAGWTSRNRSLSDPRPLGDVTSQSFFSCVIILECLTSLGHDPPGVT
ncbi:hypothetical protein BgiMline_012718, partial [Biomphalaria glabrata]